MMNKAVYWIKNLLFFLYLYGYIKLIPNIYDSGFIGILFLWFGILYICIFYYMFFKKINILNNSIPQNILSILLYLYVFLVSCKYNEINSYNIVNLFYFQINYLILVISTIGVIINNFLIEKI